MSGSEQDWMKLAVRAVSRDTSFPVIKERLLRRASNVKSTILCRHEKDVASCRDLIRGWMHSIHR